MAGALCALAGSIPSAAAPPAPCHPTAQNVQATAAAAVAVPLPDPDPAVGKRSKLWQAERIDNFTHAVTGVQPEQDLVRDGWTSFRSFG